MFNNTNSRHTFYAIFTFLGALVLLFIIAPLLGLVLSTAPSDFFETSADEEVLRSVARTLIISMAATLILGFFSIPLAYILARRNFYLKRLVLGIVDLPIVIPHAAAGIAILGFISRDSIVGQAADSIGLNFVGHPAGIGIAMAFVSVPFLINAAREGFQAVPVRLEYAALNCGANMSRVFFTVSLPLAWRSIITGFILMFARGLSEFGAVVIVAYHPMVTSVLIYERFGAFGLQYARPVAILFILVTLIFFVLLRMLTPGSKDA